MKAERHRALDLIRGLAAVGVAIYHWLQWNAYVTVQSLGLFSVYLFFILSAVTMCLIYEPVFRDGITRDAASAFFRNRAARLLPLLIAVAAAYFVLELHEGNAALPELAKAALTGSGMMALALPGYLSNTYGAWSLGTELAFYTSVPLLVMMAAQARPATIAIVFVVSLCAQQIYLWLIAALDEVMHWSLYTAFLTFAPFFCLGFLIFKTRAARSTTSLIPTLVCYGGVACFSLLWPVDLFRSAGPYLLLTGLCGGAIYFAYRSDTPAWLAGPSSFLGDISYALYLTHPFANLVVSKLARMHGIPLVWTLPAYLAAAGAAAFLIFRYFERPVRDRLRARRKPELATLP